MYNTSVQFENQLLLLCQAPYDALSDVTPHIRLVHLAPSEPYRGVMIMHIIEVTVVTLAFKDFFVMSCLWNLDCRNT